MAEDNKDSGFTPIESQEEFNRRVKERLDRADKSAEKKFKSTYAEIFQKAEQFDALQEASKSELQKAQEQLAAQNAELEKFRHRDQVNAWVNEVSAETQIPAVVLRGNTLEEIQAHAESLKSLITPQQTSPVVSSDGRRPEQNASKSTADVFADFLNSM